jgi:hypothetical protein
MTEYACSGLIPKRIRIRALNKRASKKEATGIKKLDRRLWAILFSN